METSTAIITTVGILALAAGVYRMMMKSSRAEPFAIWTDSDHSASEEDLQDVPSFIRHERGGLSLSESLTSPSRMDEDNQNCNRGGLDNYGSPRFDEQVTVEAYRNHLNKVGPVKEGIGTILARDEDDDWWPITYRPGHDALGFEKLWLYQANGPGGKFCWHISRQGWHRHARPITVTSWGTMGTIDEIREIVAQVTA
jgi:hypothetical protein